MFVSGISQIAVTRKAGLSVLPNESKARGPQAQASMNADVTGSNASSQKDPFAFFFFFFFDEAGSLKRKLPAGLACLPPTSGP